MKSFSEAVLEGARLYFEPLSRLTRGQEVRALQVENAGLREALQESLKLNLSLAVLLRSVVGVKPSESIDPDPLGEKQNE